MRKIFAWIVVTLSKQQLLFELPKKITSKLKKISTRIYLHQRGFREKCDDKFRHPGRQLHSTGIKHSRPASAEKTWMKEEAGKWLWSFQNLHVAGTAFITYKRKKLSMHNSIKFASQHTTYSLVGCGITCQWPTLSSVVKKKRTINGFQIYLYVIQIRCVSLLTKVTVVPII